MDRILQELYENRARKNMLLHDMLALTKLQKEQLISDDVEALGKATADWEEISRSIDELEERNENVIKLALVKGIQTSGHGGLEAMDVEARQLLENIREEQQACQTVAHQKMEEYRAALKDAKKSNQRLISYTNPYSAVYEDSIYFDKKK